MGMDALTSAAFDSLSKKVLPKLLERLGLFASLPAEQRQANPELAGLCIEAQELLSLMGHWFASSGDPMNMASTNDDMSDEQARALLAEMDAPGDALQASDSSMPASVEEDMSDEQARALLADMDAPADATLRSSEDMSDEQARALLADMDAPAENTSPSAIDEPLPPDQQHQSSGAHSVENTAENPEEEDEDLEEIEEFSKNDFASDPDMMSDFISNSDELMQTLDATVLELEQNPEEKETIEAIFRAAHTLKGAAGMFGFKSMERVMHRMENLFEQVRKGRLRPDANTIDVVFQGLDVLKTLLEAVKDGQPSGTKTVPVVKALSLASKGKYIKSTRTPAPASPAENKAEPEQTSALAQDDDVKSTKKKPQDPQQSTIRVDLERLDHLVNLVGELVIDRTRFASIDEEIRTHHPQINVASNMSETVQQFGRHMNEIHEIIMKIRMVPVGNAFNKFTRIVRDLSRQLGKDMELVIEGEETELDKTLVEQIGDPLIHLIRNSCDHGIEMPEDRRSGGKSPTGQIHLSARQEGNHIIITIKDDGKGLDSEKIRRKAIERGLITEESVMSKGDIFNLIFEAGFSTAEKVTTVSGRGVGMDVVRKQISKLKGLIELDSEVGKGTTITIRLPLTLAIVQSLLVESQQEVFAIPLSTVVESVRIQPEEIQRVGDAEVIKRHDKVLPLLYLHEALDLSAKVETSWYWSATRHEDAGQAHSAAQRLLRRKERLYVVIVGSGDRRFGIVVDQLLTQQEMVIKSMGPIMKNTPCVAGGAVLGNGEVVLVLDVQELEDHFRLKNRTLPAAA